MDRVIRVLGDADIPALQTFLRAHIESSLFLLGNLELAGIRDDGRRFSGTYVGCFDGDRIVGAVAHYWNGNAMVQVPSLPDVAAAVQVALDATGERGLKGLIGPDAHVLAAIDGLGVAHDRMQLDSKDRLYRLDLDALVVPDMLRLGDVTARRATRRDIDLLLRWRIDYEIALIHADDTPAMRDQARASIESATGDGLLWVLERGGTTVAMTGFNTVFEDFVQVGGVYTPPELRGKGYARAAVAASLRDARNEGRRRSILFTGYHNAPAQRAYEALGYEAIGDYRLTLLR